MITGKKNQPFKRVSLLIIIMIDCDRSWTRYVAILKSVSLDVHATYLDREKGQKQMFKMTFAIAQ